MAVTFFAVGDFASYIYGQEEFMFEGDGNSGNAPPLAGGTVTESDHSTEAAQGGEPENSPDGAWFAWATIAGHPSPFPFMDTYTTDSSSQGTSGTVFCSLAAGRFPGPTGSLVGVTPSAHGSWVRIASNRIAFTAWRILVDEDGRAAGTSKFWGMLTMDTSNTFTGTMNAEYYDQNGTAFLKITGTTTGKRITVEL